MRSFAGDTNVDNIILIDRTFRNPSKHNRDKILLIIELQKIHTYIKVGYHIYMSYLPSSVAKLS